MRRPADGRTRASLRLPRPCRPAPPGAAGVEAEAELLAAIVTFFRRLGLTAEDVGLKVSSRKVLQAVLARFGVGDDAFGPVCVVVDKMEKIPREKVGEGRGGAVWGDAFGARRPAWRQICWTCVQATAPSLASVCVDMRALERQQAGDVRKGQNAYMPRTGIDGHPLSPGPHAPPLPIFVMPGCGGAAEAGGGGRRHRRHPAGGRHMVPAALRPQLRNAGQGFAAPAWFGGSRSCWSLRCAATSWAAIASLPSGSC